MWRGIEGPPGPLLPAEAGGSLGVLFVADERDVEAAPVEPPAVSVESLAARVGPQGGGRLVDHRLRPRDRHLRQLLILVEAPYVQTFSPDRWRIRGRYRLHH